MRKLLDRLFTEDETLGLRTLVSAGLLACVLMVFLPVTAGVTFVICAALLILSLSLLGYAGLRELLPVLDPRDPDADRFAVWGALVLFLAIGWLAFGIWFLPGLILGGALLWMRAPELFEIIPGFEKPGNTGLR
ncbi:hypothetical protein [Oceanibium sediminis]|uniref:hypothetical protein n=1 Tax=Oceanibium sediminis TaxID=2026339 RepID=UPI000DD361F7|nr:hypothetical protein [Oceanibium sediminis]